MQFVVNNSPFAFSSDAFSAFAKIISRTRIVRYTVHLFHFLTFVFICDFCANSFSKIFFSSAQLKKNHAMERRTVQKSETVHLDKDDRHLTVHVSFGRACPEIVDLLRQVFKQNVVAQASASWSKVTVYALREKGNLVCAALTTTHAGLCVIRYGATQREARGRGLMRALIRFMGRRHAVLGVCSHKEVVGFWRKCGFVDACSHVAFSNSTYLEIRN